MGEGIRSRTVVICWNGVWYMGTSVTSSNCCLYVIIVFQFSQQLNNVIYQEVQRLYPKG